MLSDYILIYSLPSIIHPTIVVSLYLLTFQWALWCIQIRDYYYVPLPTPSPNLVHVFFRVSLFVLSIVLIPVVPAINPDILLVRLVQFPHCTYAAFTYVVPHNYVDFPNLH